jgi:hypothetical protein
MDSPTSEIDFACPHCGQQYSVDPSMIGHSTRCQTCGKIIMISIPGQTKTALRPTTSHLRETAATASSGKKGFCYRDFALGAIVASLAFLVGIWLNQKGKIKITPSSKSVASPVIGITSSQSPQPVSSVSSPPPQPSTPASAKSIAPKKTVESEPGEVLYKEAMRYYNGGDVLQDYNKAVELLIQASEKGSAEADGKLAAIYHDGVAGQSKDIAKAVSYAKKSGKKKTQLAHMVLGLVNFFGAKDVQTQNFEAAYSEFSNAPDYYNCLFYLGLMRYHGVGTKEDKKGAAEAFFSACRSKPDSQFAGFSALCLGYMYTEGEGVGRNIKEGDSWLMWGFKASGRVKLVAYDNWDGDERALVRHYEIRKQVIDGSTATRGLRRKYYETQELLRWSDVWPGGMDLVEKAIGRYWVTLETHY